MASLSRQPAQDGWGSNNKGHSSGSNMPQAVATDHKRPSYSQPSHASSINSAHYDSSLMRFAETKVSYVNPDQLRFSSVQDDEVGGLFPITSTQGFRMSSTNEKRDSRKTQKEFQSLLQDTTVPPSKQKSFFNKFKRAKAFTNKPEHSSAIMPAKTKPERRGSQLAEKLDQSTVETEKLSEFIFSAVKMDKGRYRADDATLNSELTPNPAHRSKVRRQSGRLLSRFESDLQASIGTLGKNHSASATSATSSWQPADELWEDSQVSSVNPESVMEQERLQRPPPPEERTKATNGKNKRPKASKSLSKKHTQKSLRRSKSERIPTVHSPVSLQEGATDFPVSPRQAFLAFLQQDKIDQSRRMLQGPPTEIRKEKKVKTKRSKSAPRPSERYAASSEVHHRHHGAKASTSKASTSKASKRALMQKQMSMSAVGSTSEKGRSFHARKEAASSRRPKVVKKQKSKSTGDTSSDQGPSLHAVFEWTRSPTSVVDPISDEAEDHPKTPRHHTPSSHGVVDRRTLLRRANSTPDIHQYHLTPEWPTPRGRNAKLHSMFYDLSMRRRGDHKDNKGLPTVSAGQMLNIMEPCSDREVLAIQGMDLELPLYREDETTTFNYGDVLDTISVTSLVSHEKAKNKSK